MPKPVSRTSPLVGVDEDVAGFDVLVNETALMQARHGVRHGNGESQERSDRQARPIISIERPGRRRLEHQHRLPAFPHELQRTECPRVIEVILQSIFMRQTADRAVSGVRRRAAPPGIRDGRRRPCRARSCGRDARRPPKGLEWLPSQSNSRSKLQFQRELHDARIHAHRVDFPERARARDIARGVGEIGPIEDVEHLPAKHHVAFSPSLVRLMSATSTLRWPGPLRTFLPKFPKIVPPPVTGYLPSINPPSGMNGAGTNTLVLKN